MDGSGLMKYIGMEKSEISIDIIHDKVYPADSIIQQLLNHKSHIEDGIFESVSDMGTTVQDNITNNGVIRNDVLLNLNSDIDVFMFRDAFKGSGKFITAISNHIDSASTPNKNEFIRNYAAIHSYWPYNKSPNIHYCGATLCDILIFYHMFINLYRTKNPIDYVEISDANNANPGSRPWAGITFVEPLVTVSPADIVKCNADMGKANYNCPFPYPQDMTAPYPPLPAGNIIKPPAVSIEFAQRKLDILQFINWDYTNNYRNINLNIANIMFKQTLNNILYVNSVDSKIENDHKAYVQAACVLLSKFMFVDIYAADGANTDNDLYFACNRTDEKRVFNISQSTCVKKQHKWHC
jgi:hypothetical protein